MATENREKIRYKVNLKPHLHELNCFTMKTMDELDLVPVEQTRAILNQVRMLGETPSFKFTIPFEEKNTDKFKSYITQLQNANSAGVYIWINRTNDCGTSILRSLHDIKWDFEFTCTDHGIFELETTDLKDSILFDFFEENGENWLEIEVSGANWPKISYS